MRRGVLLLVICLAPLAGALAGCGDDPATPVATTTTADDARPLLPGDVQQSDVEETACAANMQILQTQLQVYVAINGEPPSSMQDLVDAGLAQPTDQFEIVDGQVVAKPGGPCDR